MRTFKYLQNKLITLPLQVHLLPRKVVAFETVITGNNVKHIERKQTPFFKVQGSATQHGIQGISCMSRVQTTNPPEHALRTAGLASAE